MVLRKYQLLHMKDELLAPMYGAFVDGIGIGMELVIHQIFHPPSPKLGETTWDAAFPLIDALNKLGVSSAELSRRLGYKNVKSFNRALNSYRDRIIDNR